MAFNAEDPKERFEGTHFHFMKLRLSEPKQLRICVPSIYDRCTFESSRQSGKSWREIEANVTLFTYDVIDIPKMSTFVS